MEVVLRPVNDAFLKEVVFPALEMGVVDATPAIEHLLHFINDEHTRVQLEILLEKGVEGGFFGLEDEKWSSAVYRMLFHEWMKDGSGWLMVPDDIAYAG